MIKPFVVEQRNVGWILSVGWHVCRRSDFRLGKSEVNNE